MAATKQEKPMVIDSFGTLNATVLQLLICACCRGRLVARGASLRCANGQCASEFPVVRGIPILINEASHPCTTDDIVREFRAGAGSRSGWKDALRRFVPRISRNIKVSENLSLCLDLLVRRPDPVRVLVLGAATVRPGMGPLLSTSRIQF